MIDRKPAAGRFVFGEGATTDPVGFLGTYLGRITKISGKRVIYEKADGKEGYIYKVAACCDTEAEVTALVEVADKARNHVANCVEEANAQWAQILGYGQ